MYYKEFVKFKGNGYFYNVYDDDAYVISNIMGYKLTDLNGLISTGFPSHLLKEVLTFLDKNKISYIVDGKIKDYGKINQFRKFVKKNIPINSTTTPPIIKKKHIVGDFSVSFLEENEIEKFKIDENISADAEIVKIVYNNDVGSINTLKSGNQFKIISKNLKEEEKIIY